MRKAWLLLNSVLLAAPTFAAGSPAHGAAELQQIKLDYARVCAGQSKDIDATFTEADGTLDEIRTAKGTVIFYREGSPESLDWTANDSYVFSAATGKRLQFARTVLYAGQIFAYVKTIDTNGHSSDNARAPAGRLVSDRRANLFLTETGLSLQAREGRPELTAIP